MKIYAELIGNDKNCGIKSLQGNKMKPKSGKSSVVANLENNLIVDLEDGYRALSVMKIQARKASDMFEIAKAVKAKNAENEGKPFYRFITIDNATRLEEMALPYAKHLYRQTPGGKNYGYLKDSIGQILKNKEGNPVNDPKADIRMLPNGSGYLYLRNALKELIDSFKGLSETLILVCHMKDKTINRNDTEISELSVDLAGKSGDIICGEADAVGLIYRDGNKTIMSFKGGDNTIRESRPLHLRGKEFVVAESDEDNNLTIDTSKIFV